MPGTSDTVIASCARDGEIRLHTLAEGRAGKLAREDTLANPSRVISCHQDSVNKLATSADCPFLLWSVSDDRTVRMFDLRMKLSSDDPRAHIIARFQCSSIFFNGEREEKKRTSIFRPDGNRGLNTIALDQISPQYLLVAGTHSLSKCSF
jgi:WD40 repeat protein